MLLIVPRIMHPHAYPGLQQRLSLIDGLDEQDGQLVTFSEVEGMTELNDGNPRRVKNCRVRQMKKFRNPSRRQRAGMIPERNTQSLSNSRSRDCRTCAVMCDASYVAGTLLRGGG